MKAILIIDVDDELIGDVSYAIHASNDIISGQAKLKLLPWRKKPLGSEWENSYVEGYNKCLDDILK